MAEFDVKSVRQLIDTGFGEFGNCPIDFNTFGSVLYILARQLDVLKRKFRVEIIDKIRLINLSNATTYAVQEMKIHTKGKRHSRRRSKSGRRKLSSKDYSHILPSEHLPSTDKSSSDKRHSEKSERHSSQKRSGRGVAGSSSMEMFSPDDRFGKSHRRHGERDSDQIGPSERHRAGKHDYEMSPSERGRAGKYDDRMSTSEQRRAGKYDDDMSSSERRKARKYDDEMSPSARRKAGKYDDQMSPFERRRDGKYDDDMSSSARRKAGKYDDEMSPSARRTAGKYDDQMSPSERRRDGKYDDDMSFSARRKAGKYDDQMSPSEQRRAGKHHDDMSPDERRRTGRYSDEMSSADRRRSGKDDESHADRRRAGKFSDDMTPSVRERAGKYLSPSDRRSNESLLMGKSQTKKYRDQKTGANGGSQKKGVKYDALDFEDDENLEEQHEKIYIVTRTPSGREIRQLKSAFQPVVTQEQFKDLVEKTRALQSKFGITNMIPADWDYLRQPTSMTHPRTALNLSAQLDSAESKLAQMMDILTQLASQVPGIDIEAAFDERFLTVNENKDSDRKDLEPPFLDTPAAISRGARTETNESSRAPSTFDTTSYSEYSISEDDETRLIERVTLGQLNSALQNIYEDATVHIYKATDDTFKSIRNLDDDIMRSELKMNKVSKKLEGLYKLHYAIDNFGERVIEIDQRITSQTSLFQDNLTVMRGDLENALDKMYEALSSPQDDPAAVAQLSESFQNFQKDLIFTTHMQLELQREHKNTSKNLKNIMEKIEYLRIVKSTRDQMVEALSEKLSLKDLNGLLTVVQFDAINSDFDKILRNIDYKIYSKECAWQKIIDELYATNRACADIIQSDSLVESVRLSFEMLNKDVKAMFDLLGPLKICPTNKKLDIEGNCLSCGSPGKLKLSANDIALWKEMIPKDTALESIHIEEKLGGICIPGHAIPHPLDQNSFICEHDCGDSNANDFFELVITELNPAQASSVETRQEAHVDSHKEWCSCASCSFMKKMHAAVLKTNFKNNL